MKLLGTMLLTVLVLSGFCHTASAAEEFVATVTISPYEVQVGDPITVTYTITALNVNSIKLDPLPDTISDSAIIDASDEIFENLIGAKIFVRSLTLVPFRVEDLDVPQLAVQVIDRQGNSLSGMTPKTVIKVRSVVASVDGPEEMKKLKGLVAFEEESNLLLISILVIATVIIIGLAIWFIIKKRTPGSVQELLKLTPAERAIEELKVLLNSDALKDGKYKFFFTRLADITRRYLGLRYHILALEMTTKELHRKMTKSWSLENNKNRTLNTLLNTCDLVKFAKFSPQIEQGVEGIQMAEHIVQSTRDDNLHTTVNSLDNEGGS